MYMQLHAFHVVKATTAGYDVRFVMYNDEDSKTRIERSIDVHVEFDFTDADTGEVFDDPDLVKALQCAWLRYLYTVLDQASHERALLNALPDWKQKRITYWLYTPDPSSGVEWPGLL